MKISVTIKSRKYVCWLTNQMSAISSCINGSAQVKKDLHLIGIYAPRIWQYYQAGGGAYIQGSTYSFHSFWNFFKHYCYFDISFTINQLISHINSMLVLLALNMFMSNYKKEINVNHMSGFKSLVFILLNFVLKYNSSRISARTF